ncbi:hypothetical protein BJV78DRAFT_1161416 [Lactifluus subvellereus]|nr:hypothetical protein BJV78DRAFT_1161416 [Lactifluus subvellereus]
MATGFVSSPINDFDDTRSIASSQNGSFIDFSQSASHFLFNTRSSRARSGTVGSEDSATPIYAQHRSTIRINTDMTYPRGRPLPPTPEPDWSRTAYLGPPHPHPYSAPFSASLTAVDSSPRGVGSFRALIEDRPPTTNNLQPQERADLVRKTRKLTQLLGETPSSHSVSPHRTAERLSDEAPSSWATRRRPRPVWALRPDVQSIDSFDPLRRHSTPSSPVEPMWHTELSRVGTLESGKGRDRTKDKSARVTEMKDSASFIDLSDDDNPSSILRRVLTPHPIPSRNPSRLSDPPEPILRSRSQDEDRRRRREKMAKLHRFLGSRVPTSLVLGASEENDALPALDPSLGNIRARLPGRRRSSSAAEFKSNWFEEGDRVKEELDEREKAINVRRAVKMEKLFGVQPPQTLYHTRHSSRQIDRARSTERPSPPEREASLSAGRNVNQSPYLNKGSRQSKHRREISQSESIRPLLDSEEAGNSSGKRASAVYMHYRSSLDSLSRIIDHDDMESLAEIHSILTNAQPETEGCTSPMGDDDAKTIRSGRRFSLPARSSSLSLASQYSLSSPSPEMASFQARRRQAAKLTHFFGVDYRDLIGDIIESIERDMQEESHRGSLRPEEIQELMAKLRSLKTKRIGVL